MRNIIFLSLLIGSLSWAQQPIGASVPVNTPQVPSGKAEAQSAKPVTSPALPAAATGAKPRRAPTPSKPLPTGQSLESNSKAAGDSLTMKEFFTQVGGNNPDYKAAKDAYEGAKARAKEASLIYVPVLDAYYEDGRTEKPNTQPKFTGTSTDQTTYNIAIKQNTPFGLSGTLSYGSVFRDIDGTDPGFVPISRYYEITPQIELTQSLWRNGFGSETRATVNLTKAQQQLSLYSERLKLEGVRIEAEKTYNRLFFAREILIARKDSYEVASKMYSWAQKRAANELGEDSDTIQARSAQELRQLEILKAEDDVREASRQFNSLRGVNSDQVPDTLEAPVPNVTAKASYDSAIMTDELRLAETNLKLAEMQSKLKKEANTPTFDIYGKYALNGLDPALSGASGTSTDANDDAWNGNHPAYVVGVRFRAPLFFWTQSDVREGYDKEIEAAKLRVKRQYQIAERDQTNLLARLQNTQARFELARKLQATQKDQLDRERARHSRGRTTLFQVLTFEEQYVNSRLNVITYENELLDQINDLSLYRGE